MRKIISFFMAILLTLCCTANVFAAGNVTYEKDAGNFIFKYGSEYSETDLFSDFKDVMPGDRRSQLITVRNDASNKVKVKIYIRSLGAHQDGVSEAFLSQLKMTVTLLEDNSMGYMFDAAANETAGLTDWVLLGTLYSGGEVNLGVTLDVPETLGNEYANKVGKLDWQFMVEEFPIEPGDPEPPPTGDPANPVFWAVMAAASLCCIWVVLLYNRRKKETNA